jgi:hypothetical protein
MWTLAVGLVMLGAWGVVGCQRAKESTPLAETPRPFNLPLPTMKNVTVDAIRSALGPEFTVKEQGPPLVLHKIADPQDVLVFVAHNPQGQVENLSVDVVGPADTSEKIEELFYAAVKSLGGALGLSNTEAYNSFTDIARIYTQEQFLYTSSLDHLYFAFNTKVPLDKKMTRIAFRENYVDQQVQMLPISAGGASQWPKIPGASLTQLKTVLSDFAEAINIKDDVIVFTHEQPTYTEYVVCTLDKAKADEITYVEAFVGKLENGADRAQASQDLWLKLAAFQYEGCSPEKVNEFIVGPKLTYITGDGRKIGKAAFFLPVEHDGSRWRLTIYNEP